MNYVLLGSIYEFSRFTCCIDQLARAIVLNDLIDDEITGQLNMRFYN